ncbi:prepilin peptidase [Opitutaceae bacterium EW11]|nr:prepilin peptidase [Opitutaceae bacterium EW11]
MDFNYAEFSNAFPWFFPAAAFLFGAIVGSFLNVCIYRIPAGKSVVRPGSHCACGQPIAWYDNIPILSWFILRGKARCCGRPYSFRYPLIELITALIFLACWMLFPPGKALCGMVLSASLVCATFIDLDTFEIPDVFSVGLGIVGLLLSIVVPSLHDQHHEIALVASMRSATVAAQGMFIGAGLVLWIAVVAYAVLKKDAMGIGDVKLVGAIGAFTGWQGTVTSVFGGAILGTVWFVFALVWQKATGKKLELKSPEEGEGPKELSFGAHVPFGPMLALAGLLHFLFLHRWVASYFKELSSLL